MKENNYLGKFIVFEGLDGSGSSTQAELLTEWLRNQNDKDKKSVQLTQEPTDSLIGGLIRSQIREDWQASTECLQLLFCADRAYHLEKQIIPWLKEGLTVICDRYFFSTIAYGSAGTKNYNWLKEINKPFLLPDLTILIEVSPKECLRRIKDSRLHFELYEKEETLTKVWRIYQKLTQEFNNVKVINGEKSIKEVSKEIKEVVHSKLDL